jgi:hypothetical protein
MPGICVQLHLLTSRSLIYPIPNKSALRVIILLITSIFLKITSTVSHCMCVITHNKRAFYILHLLHNLSYIPYLDMGQTTSVFVFSPACSNCTNLVLSLFFIQIISFLKNRTVYTSFPNGQEITEGWFFCLFPLNINTIHMRRFPFRKIGGVFCLSKDLVIPLPFHDFSICFINKTIHIGWLTTLNYLDNDCSRH